MGAMKQFRASFAKLIDKPCWGVKPGWGSFLTIEFGKPHLVVREPRDSTSKSKRVRAAFARRAVRIRGEWHLWLYCCYWAVLDQTGRVMGDATSKRSIVRAAGFLDGQALVDAAFVERGVRTTLKFDLGATLITRPYDRSSEQWLLYEPNGKVFSLRADKRYAYGRGDSSPEKVRWLAFPHDDA